MIPLQNKIIQGSWNKLLTYGLLIFLVFVASFTIISASAGTGEGEHFLKIKSEPNIIFIGGGGFYKDGTTVTTEEAPETWKEYTLVGWKIDGKWAQGNPITIRMDGPHTAEAIYTKDFGGEILVDTIPRIAEITIDGQIYLPDELPASFSWESGSTHEIVIPNIVTESADTRYVFDNWKDQSSSEIRIITIDKEDTDYIALYKTQHYLKPITEQGLVLGAGWIDEGTTANFELESDIVVDRKNENIRYIFESWDLGDYHNSPSNSIDVIEPTKVKAKWDEQFRLDLQTSVPEYDLFGTGWYDNGRKVALIAEEELESINSDIKYVFEKWVSRGPNPVIIPNSHSPSTTITVNQPYVIEAVYKESYRVNVWTPYGTGAGSGFYKSGEIAEITIPTTEVLVSANKEKKVFTGWNTYGARVMTPTLEEGDAFSGASNTGIQNLFVLIDKPMNVTANWKSQYYVDVQTSYSKAQGSGWYDIGRLVPISVNERSTPPGMWSVHVFDKWVGDVESEKVNERILVNGPKSVIAEWKEDNSPGIINSIILAVMAGVAALVYKKTHFNFSGSEKTSQVKPSFNKFFAMKKQTTPAETSPEFYSKRKKSILDWLLDRD